MTSYFGVALDQAIKSGQIKMTSFKGVALGDSWIAPVDCMLSYPEYMLATSLINEVQAANLTTYALLAQKAMSQGNGDEATNYWGIQQGWAEEFAAGVNFYNFLYYTDYLPEEQLTELIDGPIRTKLGIIPTNVTWGGQSNDVFSYMSGDFMKPAVSAVDTLLSLGYTVAVYSGQLDIIVDVICIDDWMSTLTWPGITNFENAPRLIQNINGIPNGYSQSYQNLQFWGVFKAGHMVPADNGEMALAMFNAIISGNKK